MVAIATSPQKRPEQSSWFKALASPAQEFSSQQLRVLSGAIPSGLRGALYRNGPGRLSRGGQQVGHWFDGDGAILGIHFTEQGASGVYRYVQTSGYVAEAKAGKLLFGNYGMMPPGAFWNRFQYETKNSANTSVLALPDKLLALWEGGQPHALDLHTLETRGLESLSALKPQQPYSAHPKRDPETGDIYNFGVSYGKQGKLHLYHSDKTGQIQKTNEVRLDYLPMIHDFVLAGPYLVFFIPPVSLSPLPLITRIKSYSDSLQWQPKLGTEIFVIDRETLEIISRSKTEPWYQWHFGNGYLNTQGLIAVDIARYPNFKTNQFLQEVVSGQTKTEAPSEFWRVYVNPGTGKVEDAYVALERDCEFPVVSPLEIGQSTEYTYLSIRRQDAPRTDLFNTIGRFEHQTGQLTEADLGPHRYPTEPIYAADQRSPKQGWILTVVFDSTLNQSEVWIFDSAQLNHEPVCRLALPSVVPMGFHGTWQAA